MRILGISTITYPSFELLFSSGVKSFLNYSVWVICCLQVFIMILKEVFLTELNASSIGFRLGLHGGRKSISTPAFSSSSMTSGTWCMEQLPSTTIDLLAVPPNGFMLQIKVPLTESENFSPLTESV